jgi:hypothetical protein
MNSVTTTVPKDFGGQLSAMIDGIQVLTNLVNSQNQQIGVINKTVQAMDARLVNVEVQGSNNSDRITHLEEDQFVDLIKADNIRFSAQSRVAELLHIELDERGGITDEAKDGYDYTHYFSKFCGRIHTDARHAGLEGPRIYATPRKNYQALLNFINEWVPRRGVEGLKSYYDGLEAARHAKSKKSA